MPRIETYLRPFWAVSCWNAKILSIYETLKVSWFSIASVESVQMLRTNVRTRDVFENDTQKNISAATSRSTSQRTEVPGGGRSKSNAVIGHRVVPTTIIQYGRTLKLSLNIVKSTILMRWTAVVSWFYLWVTKIWKVFLVIGRILQGDHDINRILHPIEAFLQIK